jgi:hypothetical protein
MVVGGEWRTQTEDAAEGADLNGVIWSKSRDHCIGSGPDLRQRFDHTSARIEQQENVGGLLNLPECHNRHRSPVIEYPKIVRS